MNKLILSITTLLIITLLIITSSITYASDATLTTNTDWSKTVSRSGTSYTVQWDDLYWYYYWWWSEASYNDNWSPINWKNNFNLNPTNWINDAWSNVNWPCPTWYHVPSIEEWNWLINIWCKLYNNHCADGDVSNWIILNWNILYNNKKALGDEFLGTFNMDATHIYETDSFYWSSSSTGNDRALELRISPSSIAVQSSVRSNRDRVLCFKNEIIPNTYQNNWQIIHNEEEWTITFVYWDNSITIMDKNVWAENVWSWYDADSSSYWIKMAYSWVVEKDWLYELEEWENDPCNNIWWYIPAPLDWQSLLDMRWMIRKW